MSTWRITEFSEQKAAGRVAEPGGDERPFSIEAWLPCDPALAVELSMSDAYRSLLLPRVGEAVDVELRGPRAVRVIRREKIDIPTASFREWFATLCSIVPAMAGWSAGTWQAIESELDDIHDLDETRNDPRPSRLEHWWLLLAWMREHGRGGTETTRRLGWLHLEPAPSCIAIATDEDPVFVDATLANQLVLARVAMTA